MNKPFETVMFQRKRRQEISKALARKSPKEIVKYFQTNMPTTTVRRRRRSRATAHNSSSNDAGRG